MRDKKSKKRPRFAFAFFPLFVMSRKKILKKIPNKMIKGIWGWPLKTAWEIKSEKNKKSFRV